MYKLTIYIGNIYNISYNKNNKNKGLKKKRGMKPIKIYGNIQQRFIKGSKEEVTCMFNTQYTCDSARLEYY